MNGEIYLENAKKNLVATRLLLKKGHYNASATRAYFAAFHAAIVALGAAGVKIDFEKKIHRRVQRMFTNELINQKKAYPRFKGYLSALQAVREEADYKRVSASAERVKRQLKKAEDFIQQVEQKVLKR